MIEIVIEPITGRAFKLHVSLLETVYFVKVKICQLEGIPISHQILIWKNTELRNEFTLFHYSISNNATLRLTLTMKGGPINSILTEEPTLQDMVEYLAETGDGPSTSSSSSSLVSEKKHGTLILYRYGDRTVKIAREVRPPDALSVEKWKVKLEDLKEKNERQLENRKLRDKMADVRRQMKNLALSKDSKAETTMNTSTNFSTNFGDHRITSSRGGNETTHTKTSSYSKHHKYVLSSKDLATSTSSPSREMGNLRQFKVGDAPPNTTCNNNINIDSGIRSIDKTFAELPSRMSPSMTTRTRVASTAVDPDSTLQPPWLGQEDVRWDNLDLLAFLNPRFTSESSLSCSTPVTSCSSETNLENEDDDDDDVDENNNSYLPSEDFENTVTVSPFHVQTSCDFPTTSMMQVDDSKPADFHLSDGLNVQKILNSKLSSVESEMVPSFLASTKFDPTDADERKSVDLIRSFQNGETLEQTEGEAKAGICFPVLKPPTFLDAHRNSRHKNKPSDSNEQLFLGDVHKSTATMRNEALHPIAIKIPKLNLPISKPSTTKMPLLTNKKWWENSGEFEESKRGTFEDAPYKTKTSSKNLVSQPFLPSIKNSPRTPTSPPGKMPKLQNPLNPFPHLPPIHPRANHRQQQSKILPPPLIGGKDTTPSRDKSALLRSFGDTQHHHHSNYSNLPWYEHHHLYHTASTMVEEEGGREDDISDEEAFYSTINGGFPTLEISGSAISSDLNGYRLKIGKLLFDERASPRLPDFAMVRMLETIVGNTTLKSRGSAGFSGRREVKHGASVPSEKGDENSVDHSMPNQPAPKKKCAVCHKKTSLAASFICRCGQNLCSSHRYPETHACTIDYKIEGRKLLEERNPVVKAPKLPKI